MRASDLRVVSFCQSLSLTLASGGGESDSDSLLIAVVSKITEGLGGAVG